MNRIVAKGAVWVMVMASGVGADAKPFQIHVVDGETSRGIPMVTLETTFNARYVTDSRGCVAFDEPLVMGKPVFFRPVSDGYTFPSPPLAMGGATLTPKPDTSATIVMKREMVAERIYRITGAGIYRDTVALGDSAPIDQPLLNAGVVGQDSTLCSVFDGQVFWIWGDTTQMRHPLGNFRSTGAWSDLPASGGLPVDVGVNLHYIAEGDFVKPMVARQPGDKSNMYWLSCLMTVPDEAGQEHLLAWAANVEGTSMKTLNLWVLEFNKAAQEFEVLADWPTTAPLQPGGHAVRAEMETGTAVGGDGGDGDAVTTAAYMVFNGNGGFTRVRATYEAARDPHNYEALTCVEGDDGFSSATAKLLRDDNGRARFVWKKSVAAVGAIQQRELVEAGLLKPEECLFRPVDAETGKPFKPHGCTVAWNDYRQRWIMIASEIGGSSMLGEAWYLESDKIQGPWVKGVKVVTHANYTLYNPLQHPELIPAKSKFLYFEGTYTRTFSGAQAATPWYDYNQLMFRVNLDDERLKLAR